MLPSAPIASSGTVDMTSNETGSNRTGNTSLSSGNDDTPIAAVSVLNLVAVVLLGVIFVSGFVLNLFVTIAVLSNRHLRHRVADIMCCHLAVVGLVWCIAVLPISIVSAATSALGDGWAALTDGSFCIVHGYFRSAVTHVVVWTVTALGYDKYRTIMSPLHYVSDFRHVSGAIAVIWICSFVLAGPPLVTTLSVGEYGHLGSISGCGYVPPTLTHSSSSMLSASKEARSPFAAIAYVTVVLVLGFLLPLVVVMHCYFRIYHVARWHRRRISAMTAVVNVITLSLGVPIITRGLQQQQQQQQQHDENHQQQLPSDDQQQATIETANRNRNPSMQISESPPEVEDDIGGGGDAVAARSVHRRRRSFSASHHTLFTVVGSFFLCFGPHHAVHVINTCLTVTSSTSGVPSVSGGSAIAAMSPLVIAVADLFLLATPFVNGFVYGVRNRTMVKSFRLAVCSAAFKDTWNRAASPINGATRG